MHTAYKKPIKRCKKRASFSFSNNLVGFCVCRNHAVVFLQNRVKTKAQTYKTDEVT